MPTPKKPPRLNPGQSGRPDKEGRTALNNRRFEGATPPDEDAKEYLKRLREKREGR
jgi:hypothetical protein